MKPNITREDVKWAVGHMFKLTPGEKPKGFHMKAESTTSREHWYGVDIFISGPDVSTEKLSWQPQAYPM